MGVARSDPQNVHVVREFLWDVTNGGWHRGLFLLSLMYELLAVLFAVAGLGALFAGSAEAGGLQIATGILLAITGVGLCRQNNCCRTMALAISWFLAVVAGLLTLVSFAVYVVLWFGGSTDQSFLFRTLAFGGCSLVLTCLCIQSIYYLSADHVRRIFEFPGSRAM